MMYAKAFKWVLEDHPYVLTLDASADSLSLVTCRDAKKSKNLSWLTNLEP